MIACSRGLGLSGEENIKVPKVNGCHLRLANYTIKLKLEEEKQLKIENSRNCIEKTHQLPAPNSFKNLQRAELCIHKKNLT